MPPKFSFLHFFENQTLAIIEIKRVNFEKMIPTSGVHNWITYDKRTGLLTQLSFRSSDSSGVVEERYFDQGYLKFNQEEATFIEKFNSAQHTLKNNIRNIDNNLILILEHYLKEPLV